MFFANDSVDETLTRLNRQYYETSPSEYFWHRWLRLVLVASRWEDLARLLAGGVAVGDLTYSAQVESDDKDRQRYLVAESYILLHHTGEALLRMFLAHASSRGCPWIEAAVLVEYPKFQAAISEMATRRDEVRDVVPAVFYCQNVLDTVNPDGLLGGLDVSIENVTDLLLHFAGIIENTTLRRAYNATKHGFVASPTSAGFTLELSPDAQIDQTGDVLDYIDVDKRANPDGWELNETVVWVEPEENLALVHFAVLMMENLWACGRFQHLGVLPPRLHAFPSGLPELMRASASIRAKKPGLPFVRIPYVPHPLPLVVRQHGPWPDSE